MPDKLRVSHLNFHYGDNHVLHDVSLAIPPRQVTALIGPSGCGKSTFLRTLNRMHETVRNAHAVGELLLDGEDMLAMDVVSLRRRVGMVFQKAQPFPTMTIFNNVAAGLRLNGMHNYNQLASVVEESLQLFTLIALNCAIRNGDAHLKNFGILYDEVAGDAHIAPVYDLVTTSVYLPQDRMALTLNGTNQWPSTSDLLRFGEGRSLGSRGTLTRIFECISDALSATSYDVQEYGKQHPEFLQVGRQMLEHWETGRRHPEPDLLDLLHREVSARKMRQQLLPPTKLHE